MAEERLAIGPSSLAHLDIPLGPPHPCPYLPGRDAMERAFYAEKLPSGFYRPLMDHGWRRSGKVIYRPDCGACQECQVLRIPTARFRPDRTQRKVLRRNAAIETSLLKPNPTDEKFDLFVRYQKSRHTGDMCTVWDEFIRFLYDSPVVTREVECRIDGKLAAIAIVDFEPGAISSVYSFYDPEMTDRSLGTWLILWLLAYGRDQKFAYYYLGYHIEGCRKMNYKTRFLPCELGDGRGNWRVIERPSGKGA